MQRVGKRACCIDDKSRLCRHILTYIGECFALSPIGFSAIMQKVEGVICEISTGKAIIATYDLIYNHRRLLRITDISYRVAQWFSTILCKSTLHNLLSLPSIYVRHSLMGNFGGGRSIPIHVRIWV